MRKKVLIGVLTLVEVGAEVSNMDRMGVQCTPYGSQLAFVYRCGRENPDYDFMLASPRRMAIDRMRNMVVESALQLEADYIFFFDDDTVLDPHIMKNLLERDKPCISACYFIRGYPFNLMAFEKIPLTKDELERVPPPHTGQEFKMQLMEDWQDKEDEETGLLGPLAAVGCGCTLIKTDVFKSMPMPWFKTAEGHTEDVYFCRKAYDFVEGFEAYMDMNIICEHTLDPITVHKGNRELLHEFYEKLYGYRKEDFV